jgi:periodic tryptophan protein 1
MFLACKTEEELSQLDIYVYVPEDDNLYVHHDLMLASYPICIEPVHHPLKQGHRNYVAIGTFDPEIEIWDMDIVDTLRPEVVLGKAPKGEKKKKKVKYSFSFF